MLAFGALVAPTAASLGAIGVPYPNGNFELGAAGWSLASTTVVADADESGDREAILAPGCGDGTWQLSRGLSKGAVPGTATLSFAIENGVFDQWDLRMILADAEDPGAYANDLYPTDPLGILAPDWLDDQVLVWHSWSVPLDDEVRLDPVRADAVNIPGWDTMSDTARADRLAKTLQATIVMYGCTANGVTLDNFASGL